MVSHASLYGPLFGTPELDAVWSDENLVRTWLETELAVAQALDENDYLEPGALADIRRAASIDHIDLTLLRTRTRQVGMPIKPLVEQVVAAAARSPKSTFTGGRRRRTFSIPAKHSGCAHPSIRSKE